MRYVQAVSYWHYLIIIIFKFNCKSDFTSFANFRFVGYFYILYLHDVVVKKFTFAVSSRDELLVLSISRLEMAPQIQLRDLRERY